MSKAPTLIEYVEFNGIFVYQGEEMYLPYYQPRETSWSKTMPP